MSGTVKTFAGASVRRLAAVPAFAPASSLPRAELADLFNAGYSDYFVPIEVDEPALDGLVAAWDIDLDASRVARLDGRPAGFAFLAIRGLTGWIGGMGVEPDARRRGLGDALMRGVIDVGRERGLKAIWLEVLEQNAPARALYEKLGFEHVRDLEIWELEHPPTGGAAAREVGVDEAHAWIRANRSEREPWQRADEAVLRRPPGAPPLTGLVVDGGAAVVGVGRERAGILQLVGEPDAARRLVAATAALAPKLLWVNVPSDHPATMALRDLGGRVAERQLELVLAP